MENATKSKLFRVEKNKKPKSNVIKQEKVNSQPKIMLRQNVPSVKLTGFCDIVSQAAIKKKAAKSIIYAKTKATESTKTKTTESTKTTTTSTTSIRAKSETAPTLSKWEQFREKKLSEMKQHKINIERRMQRSCNIDGQMYWSQRADKLKRLQKSEALHPSWYTENIYSNRSFDLDTNVFFGADSGDAGAWDQFEDLDYEVFQSEKKNEDASCGHLKISRSCCFESGYDGNQKAFKIPNSNSFTGTCIQSTVPMYSTPDEGSYLEMRRENNYENNIRRSGLRKFYCWENSPQQNIYNEDLHSTSSYHLDYDCYAKRAEVYQIERDQNFNKQIRIDNVNDAQDKNANYIRNIWDRHNTYKVQNNNEENSNLRNHRIITQQGMRSFQQRKLHDYANPHHSTEEEYLIFHQDTPNNNLFPERNSFDDPILMNLQQGIFNTNYSSILYLFLVHTSFTSYK